MENFTPKSKTLETLVGNQLANDSIFVGIQNVMGYVEDLVFKKLY